MMSHLYKCTSVSIWLKLFLPRTKDMTCVADKFLIETRNKLTLSQKVLSSGMWCCCNHTFILPINYKYLIRRNSQMQVVAWLLHSSPYAPSWRKGTIDLDVVSLKKKEWVFLGRENYMRASHTAGQSGGSSNMNRLNPMVAVKRWLKRI